MALTDTQIATTLDRTAAASAAILDVLATFDPLDLKQRTFGRRWYDVIPTRFGDTTATVLDVADWPGTAGWEKLSVNERADWWVNRVGALVTVGVAFPSMFGAWTKRLPVGTYLGAASQALMVIAICREYGVRDRGDQIAVLGDVLFGRTLDGSTVQHVEPVPFTAPTSVPALLKGLWDIAMDLRELTKALGARPQAPSMIRHLGWVPLVGGPAMYLGERVALCRAVGQTQRWIVDHPDAVRAR